MVKRLRALRPRERAACTKLLDQVVSSCACKAPGEHGQLWVDHHAKQLVQHAQAALVPVASGKVGGRVAICICCRQAGRRLAAQLMQHSQAALVPVSSGDVGGRAAK